MNVLFVSNELFLALKKARCRLYFLTDSMFKVALSPLLLTFSYFDEGVYIGPVSEETIAQLRKSN